MKQVYCCGNCGSTDIQAKAWVGMNSPFETDFSLSEDSTDDSNFWCGECSEHTTPESYYEYEPNDEVHWTDPDADASSGVYKVVQMVTDDGANSIYLISNGASEAEVFAHELK